MRSATFLRKRLLLNKAKTKNENKRETPKPRKETAPHSRTPFFLHAKKEICFAVAFCGLKKRKKKKDSFIEMMLWFSLVANRLEKNEAKKKRKRKEETKEKEERKKMNKRE